MSSLETGTSSPDTVPATNSPDTEERRRSPRARLGRLATI